MRRVGFLADFKVLNRLSLKRSFFESMENQKHRVAIYTRVSTVDQESGNQLIELREYCRARGWDIVAEFVDEVSGSTDQRSEFQAMKLAAQPKTI